MYSDSRYADGVFFKASDARNFTFQVGALRTFPNFNAPFYYYTWVTSDRIDTVAFKIYGDSDRWWTIMDANPEINDPLNIVPGTTLRIPSV